MAEPIFFTIMFSYYYAFSETCEKNFTIDFSAISECYLGDLIDSLSFFGCYTAELKEEVLLGVPPSI